MADNQVLLFQLNSSPDYQPLLEGAPQTHGMRSGRVFLKPGEACGRHSTGDHEEQLIFLAGKGVALTDKSPDLPVAAGHACYFPPHTEHDIVNTGDNPLVYIYCVAPIHNFRN